MKNLNLGVKLGIGFGIILLISICLGGVAILKMKEQEQESNKISEAFIPEVTLATQYERAMRQLRDAVVRFSNSGDEDSYRTAREKMEQVKTITTKIDAHVNAFPFLTDLKERSVHLRQLFGEYQKLVERMHESVMQVERLRVHLGQLGDHASATLVAVLEASGDVLDRDMSGNYTTMADALKWVRNIRRGNDALNTLLRIQVANNRMQAMRDLSNADKALEDFKEVIGILEAFKKVARPENVSKVAAAIDSVQQYHDAFENMVGEWRKQDALLKQASDVGHNVLELATEVSTMGMDTVTVSCNANKELGEEGVSLVTVALIVAVLICVLLAVMLTRAITGPLGKTVAFATAVAGGDLNRTLDLNQTDEVGRLADALKSMVATLAQRIKDATAATDEAQRRQEEATKAMREAELARKEAEQAKRQGMLDAAAHLESVVIGVNQAADELASQVKMASAGAQEQAARISETATAMEEMNSTVLEVARNAGTTAEMSATARDKASSGSDVVQKVVAGMATINGGAEELRTEMQDLSQKAESIGAILNVISDIADQTNLLALNAAIEAARAGEAGRGFAVVADEVRKLAEKTMQATAQVGQAIRGIQDGTAKNMTKVETTVHMVDEVTSLANDSGMALAEIVSLVDSESDQIRAIATASEEQSATSEEINRSVEHVSRIASETASAMQAASEVVVALGQQAQALDSLIREMKNQ